MNNNIIYSVFKSVLYTQCHVYTPCSYTCVMNFFSFFNSTSYIVYSVQTQ